MPTTTNPLRRTTRAAAEFAALLAASSLLALAASVPAHAQPNRPVPVAQPGAAPVTIPTPPPLHAGPAARTAPRDRNPFKPVDSANQPPAPVAQPMPRPVMPMPGALPVAEPVVAPEPEPMDEFADIRARGSLVGLVDGKELWRLETRYHYIPTEAEALAASEREIARQKALKKAEEK